MTTAGIITLSKSGHTAQFFHELFPGYGKYIQGSLAFQVTSTAGLNQVSAVALRSNDSPYNMTSFAVVSGTAGNSYTANLPRIVYTDIMPNTTPPTLNKVAAWGPSITAAVTGYGYVNFYGANYTFGKQIHAVSTKTGKVYKAKTDPSTIASATSPVTSVMSLPPGDYRFRTMGWLTYSTTSTLWAAYTSPSFSLTSTTTVNMNVPTPTQHMVSGTIANFSSLGVTTSASLTFYGTDTSNSNIQYVVACFTDNSGGGTFSSMFPDGNFKAILESPKYLNGTATANATVNLGLQNIGTVSVTGADTTVNNLTVPTLATLSGTAAFAGGTLPIGKFTITAGDTSMPNFGYNNLNFSFWPGGDGTPNNAFDPTSVYYGYVYIPRDTTWTINTFGGAYDVKLGAGSSYNLSYSMSVYNSAGTSVYGTLTYTPASGKSVNLTSAGQFSNFPDMAALPSAVPLTGKVLGLGGTAQTGTVIARSSSIIGANGNIIPDLTYYAQATESTTGTYTIYLLPGYNYEITFGSTVDNIIQ